MRLFITQSISEGKDIEGRASRCKKQQHAAFGITSCNLTIRLDRCPVMALPSSLHTQTDFTQSKSYFLVLCINVLNHSLRWYWRRCFQHDRVVPVLFSRNKIIYGNGRTKKQVVNKILTKKGYPLKETGNHRI